MDLKRIEALIEVIKDANVTELALKRDDSSVVVRKSPKSNGTAQVTAVPKAVPNKPAADASVEAPETVEKPVVTVIAAPMVGIFHMVDGIKSSGTTIKKGQVVGMIESMKLMNEVTSQFDGEINEILVEDGMPVEYGQTLFRLSH